MCYLLLCLSGIIGTGSETTAANKIDEKDDENNQADRDHQLRDIKWGFEFGLGNRATAIRAFDQEKCVIDQQGTQADG
jgi:hypothetical protein